MTSGFHLQLLLFTVLGPAGALGFVLASAFVLAAPKEAPWLFKLERCLLLPIFLCMLGLVIAATHLGTPRNALYVLLGAGRSPLSNEMVATIAFLALAWLFWLMLTMRRLPASVMKVWLGVSCVAALIMVHETSLAYSIETLPTWNSFVAPVMFWTGALVSGSSVALCTLRLAKAPVKQGHLLALMGFQGLGLVGGIAALVAYYTDMQNVSSALTGAQGALGLVPDFWLFVVGFFLLGLLSVALNAWAVRRMPKGSFTTGAVKKCANQQTVRNKERCACEASGANVTADLKTSECSSTITSPFCNSNSPDWLPLLIAGIFAFAAVILMRIPFYLFYMTVGL